MALLQILIFFFFIYYNLVNLYKMDYNTTLVVYFLEEQTQSLKPSWMLLFISHFRQHTFIDFLLNIISTIAENTSESLLEQINKCSYSGWVGIHAFFFHIIELQSTWIEHWLATYCTTEVCTLTMDYWKWALYVLPSWVVQRYK